MAASTPLHWKETDGGPFVVMPMDIMSEWQGAESRQGTSHYDTACAVDDLLGIVNCCSTPVLVLGDEPFETAWYTSEVTGSTYLLRWNYGENEEDVAKCLAEMERQTFRDELLIPAWDTDRLVCFDAAYPGDEVRRGCRPEQLRAPVSRVATLEFEPDDETSLFCHKFE